VYIAGCAGLRLGRLLRAEEHQYRHKQAGQLYAAAPL